ncbi:MAG: hemolysin III family protein [Victivallaceae bacterium]|nr:hemolysin III family protein [Victivallaceae bacterium]
MSKVKSYSVEEERANVITHLAGAIVVIAGVGGAWGVLHCRSRMAAIGFLIYSASLLAMYIFSTVYHYADTNGKCRGLCRKFDHAAIYLLIAGTYTPIMITAVPNRTGMWILIAEWGLAAIGLLHNFLFFGKFSVVTIILYLAMGWLCAVRIDQLYDFMTATEFGLILFGGLAYTVGVVFYIMKVKYSHAIWHLFVLAGSTLQFFAIILLCFC